MKLAFPLLAALLVGLAIGFFAGGHFAPAPSASTQALPREAQPASGVREAEPPLENVAPPRESVSTREAQAATEDTRSAVEDLIGPRLREYARQGIRTAWKESRSDEISDERLEFGMRDFESSVLSLPAAIGRRLAAERSREELLARDARTGGAFALLDKLSKTPTPMLELATDPAAMQALLARASPETTVRAEGLGKSLAKQLESGKTYSYPAGVFPIELNFNGLQQVPQEVTIAGAGMDATLLVLSGDIFADKPLQRFSIRDCTVFTNNNYLFDQRGAPATVLLERMRVVGFDMGAGSSCALGFSSGGLVLLARDCRFEGGYGRNPAYGQLMDIRSPALVARMERCRVERVTLGADRLSADSTLLFSQCTLSDLLDPQMRFAAAEQRLAYEQALHAKPGLVFQGTTISFFDNAAWNLPLTSWDVPARDLNELFPGWQQALGH
ncbi:MAG: hypothetical protein IPJ19_11585 [Planctomycetes bacterium]|nr:hypothetical protein [Planctomycetota bacterium]